MPGPVTDDTPRVLARDQGSLMASMGELLVSLRAGRPKQQICRTASRTLDLAARLFAAEERAMRSSRYPNMARHCSEHALFLERMAAIRQSLDADDPAETGADEILGWWSVAHLVGADPCLSDYLKRWLRAADLEVASDQGCER